MIRLLLFSLLGCLCVFPAYGQGQKLDSLLFLAYRADNDQDSWRLFKEADALVNSAEDEARYDYFKYFYHYKLYQHDSVDYYEAKVLPQMEQLEQWDRYFSLCNNRYHTIEESGASEKAILFAKSILEKAVDLESHSNVVIFNAFIGNSYHNISFYEKGVKQARIGYEYGLRNSPEEELALSSALNIMAINFDDWGKLDSAIYYHRKVLALTNVKDTKKTSTFNNIGNTYLKKGMLDSADIYISKSLELSLLEADPYHLSTAYNNKGDVLLRKEEYQPAKQYIDSALNYAVKSLSLEKKRDVHNTLNRYYLALDSSALALKHSELFHAFKDSMVNSEKLQIIDSIEKDELELEQKEALFKRNLWIVISISVVIILSISLRQVILKRKRLEKEAQLQLQEERLRISRDLHDNIGAELSYMSSLIDQKLYQEQDEETRAELSELGDSSRSAMNQLRETIWAIQTEEITLEKFKNKLLVLSKRYSDNLKINVTVEQEGINHLLNPVQAINMFRVCQEAINNAFKYADHNHVHVKIIGNDQLVTAIISDKGLGFNPETVTSGYGLNNMRERAEQLGGEFTIQSEPGRGTQVALEFPLDQK